MTTEPQLALPVYPPRRAVSLHLVDRSRPDSVPGCSIGSGVPLAGKPSFAYRIDRK